LKALDQLLDPCLSQDSVMHRYTPQESRKLRLLLGQDPVDRPSARRLPWTDGHRRWRN